MKKRWWIIGAIAVIGAVIAWVAANSQESVPAIQLKKEDVISTLTVTGEVRGDTTVAFSPPVSAQIAAVHVDEGDFITPGQTLVELDTDQIQAQVRESQARAAQAQASYANVMQGTRPEQIRLWEERYRESAQRIRTAEAALSAARLRAQEAARNAQRFEGLYRDDLVSAQEYESAQTQADVAQREIDRLQAELAASRRQRTQIAAQLAEARRGATQPEIREAAEAARAARANTQAVREQLRDYRIISNMQGIITQRLQDPGELARPGEPVLRAVNPATLEIVCEVEENDLSKVQADNTAYVVLDALPEIPLEARVRRIGSQVNPENGTVEARVVLQPKAWSQLRGVRLMPGMTADVNVVSGRLNNALVLPATAVRTEGANTWVYVFENNRLHKRSIKAERISMENFRIIRGLQSGEWVALSAGDALLDKKNVKPVPAEQVSDAPRPPLGQGRL
jgi:HlyD family secretion protein